MNDLINGLLNNKILVSSLISILLAQILKVIIILLMEHKIDLEKFFREGGMPSSHSAGVLALSTSSFIIYGPSSYQFAFAFVLSVIVLHDAHGVRYESGKQAKAINEIRDVMSEKFELDAHKELNELLGHTGLQIFFGSLLGIVVSLIICLA